MTGRGLSVTAELLVYHSGDILVINVNKRIRDDTKAAAGHSLNCIKKQKINKYGEERFLPRDAYA